MLKKKSHVSHKSHDVVIDSPEDAQLGLPSSMDAYVEPSVSGDKGPKLAKERMKAVFKAESTRTSVKSQYTARNLKGKYYGMTKAVKMSTPQYEGNTHIGYIILFLQFLRTAVDIWWHSRKISTRAMRKIVVIEIALMIFLGFVFTLAGVFKITRHQDDDDSSDFYWAMTLVATVVLSLAIVGSIGIFRPSIKTTEIFAVLSFIFGHLIFSIVVSWYLLVVLDSVLSDKYFEAEMHKKHRRAIDNNIYKDTFLEDYFKLLIVISLVMMSSGVITTKLLIQIRRNQGYVNVFTEVTHK